MADHEFLQEIAWNLGGEVTKCDHREYGPADITVSTFGNGSADALFQGLGNEMKVSKNYRAKVLLIKFISGLDVARGSTIEAAS